MGNEIKNGKCFTSSWVVHFARWDDGLEFNNSKIAQLLVSLVGPGIYTTKLLLLSC